MQHKNLNIQSHIDYANLAESTGWLDQAISSISKAIKHDLSKSKYSSQRLIFMLIKRANLYDTQLNYEAAYHDYSSVIKFSPLDPTPYFYRAHISYQLGAYTEMIEDITKGIALSPIGYNPEFAIFYNNRGVAHYLLNQKDAAIKDFTTSIILDSEDPSAYIHRGILHYYNNDKPNMMADFEKALTFFPKDVLTNNTPPELLKVKKILQNLPCSVSANTVFNKNNSKWVEKNNILKADAPGFVPRFT